MKETYESKFKTLLWRTEMSGWNKGVKKEMSPFPPNRNFMTFPILSDIKWFINLWLALREYDK